MGVYVPAVVGLPLITPLEFMLRPAGSPLADHVKDVSLPLDCMVANGLYVVFAIPLGSDAVVMERVGHVTFITYDWEAVLLLILEHSLVQVSVTEARIVL